MSHPRAKITRYPGSLDVTGIEDNMNTEVQVARASKKGWIWLSEDNEDLEDLPVDELLAEHSPGTVFRLTLDDHLAVDAVDDLDPESLLTRGFFPDEPWQYEAGEFEVLLLVEQVDSVGDPRSDDEGEAVDYRVVAVHTPRDIYGPKGTALRDAIEVLEGAAGARVIKRMPAITTNEELERIRSFEQAAKDAVIAAGLDRWGFKDSVWTLLPGSCQHGAEYVAIVARELIGTTPEWTQDAYDYLSRRFVAATGRSLHPDDKPVAASPA